MFPRPPAPAAAAAAAAASSSSSKHRKPAKDSLPKRFSQLKATPAVASTSPPPPAPAPVAPTKPTLSPDWTVSVWSKAGVSTTILARSRHSPQTLLFDCGGLGGVAPTVLSQADLVFVSHAHADHCGGLFAHARSRFACASPARYFVPEDSLEELERARASFERLDGHELKMDFVPVRAGFKRDLGCNGLHVECVATEHRVASVGYLVYKDVTSMRSEYASASGKEKAELGRKKLLYETRRELQLSYSGDTTVRGLDPRLFQSRLAIIECTFVNDAHAHLARDTQHVLLSELAEQLSGAVEDNDCQLLLVHFSARYTARQIIDAVKRTTLLRKPAALALAGFTFDPLSKEQDVGIQFV